MKSFFKMLAVLSLIASCAGTEESSDCASPKFEGSGLVPFYVSSDTKDYAGYVKSSAKISGTGEKDENKTEVKVQKGSRLKGKTIWVDTSKLSCM